MVKHGQDLCVRSWVSSIYWSTPSGPEGLPSAPRWLTTSWDCLSSIHEPDVATCGCTPQRAASRAPSTACVHHHSKCGDVLMPCVVLMCCPLQVHTLMPSSPTRQAPGQLPREQAVLCHRMQPLLQLGPRRCGSRRGNSTQLPLRAWSEFSTAGPAAGNLLGKQVPIGRQHCFGTGCVTVAHSAGWRDALLQVVCAGLKVLSEWEGLGLAGGASALCSQCAGTWSVGCIPYRCSGAGLYDGWGVGGGGSVPVWCVGPST